MTVGDSIISGQQLLRKPRLRNRGKFDTEHVPPSALHCDRASFSESQPPGIVSVKNVSYRANVLEAAPQKCTAADLWHDWNPTEILIVLVSPAFKFSFFSIPLTLRLLVLLRIMKSSETRKWNLTWEYFHLLPIKNGYVIPKICGFACQTWKMENCS